MKFSIGVLLPILLFSPAALFAGRATTYEVDLAADSGLVINTAIDIIEHSSGVWFASGKGLVHTFDGGRTWLTFSDQNGLVSDDISAVFSIDGRIWVGTSHGEIINGRLETISDGVSFSDDDGNTWTQIDFGVGGLNIPFVFGGNQTVFDITGHADLNFSDQSGEIVDWLFFPAFAGGLVSSIDGGVNWRRIFPSVSDSIQYADEITPSLRNRAFSAVVDSSHGDSLFLWTGTAGGVFQYIYAPPRQRLFSKVINGIIFCDTCSSAEDTSIVGRLYFGGDNSFSWSNSTGRNFSSRFEDEGLPGRSITSLFDLRGHLLVGTVDPSTGNSTGLALSNDEGNSFTTISLSGVVVGAGRSITDFNIIRNRLYMAASTAGLFVSSDTGLNWTAITVDSGNSTSATNIVHSLNSVGDTLYVGTDSGFVSLFMSVGGTIDSSVHLPFTETDSTSSVIFRVKNQPFIPDSNAIWAITRPATAIGVESLQRSNDGGRTWQVIFAPVTLDIDFIKDTAFIVGELGIRRILGVSTLEPFSAKQFINGNIEIANLDLDTVTAVSISEDTIAFGTRRGVAVSTDRGASFTIFRPNLDRQRADAVINFTAVNTFDAVTQRFGLAGDFVPAMAVQNVSGGSSRIWASGRAVDFGGDGIAVARFVQFIDTTALDTLGNIAIDTTIRPDWESVYFDGFAWNIAFSGDSIFAATNGGLLLNTGDFTNDSTRFIWDTVQLIDPVTQASLLDPNSSVFAVRAINDTLWLGTGDGTISIDLSNPANQMLYQRVDSTTPVDEVYAYPIPFSGQRGGTVDFHFVIEQDGPVTLEVYDFAMNLVARPIDNEFFSAGIYPTGGAQGRNWDGTNGKGDFVAVGVYYFKVEQANGAVRWGKLAVIP